MAIAAVGSRPLTGVGTSDTVPDQLPRCERASRPLYRMRSSGGEKGRRPLGFYSCGSASGCAGTAEASGPGPAPSR